jgi:hypothetical protein
VSLLKVVVAEFVAKHAFLLVLMLLTHPCASLRIAYFVTSETGNSRLIIAQMFYHVNRFAIFSPGQICWKLILARPGPHFTSAMLAVVQQAAEVRHMASGPTPIPSGCGTIEHCDARSIHARGKLPRGRLLPESRNHNCYD